MTDHRLPQLKQAARDLAEPLELPALARLLAARAADLLPADYAAVYALEESGVPQPMAECGTLNEAHQAVAAALLGQAAAHGMLAMVGGEAPGEWATLAVPLRWGGHPLGVLLAHGLAFAPDVRDLAEMLAAQAAAAWGHHQLHHATQQQVAQLTILHEIALATVTAASVDEVVAAATRVLSQRLDYDVIGVGLLDQSGQHYYAHPSYVRKHQVGSWPQALPVTRGLVGLALRTGQAVRVAEVRGHGDYWADDPAVQSELVVPLAVGQRVIGVLNAESYHAGAFSAADQQVLTGVAGVLAPLIENAQLRDKAEHQARDLDLLARVQEAASASLDMHAVLTAIVEQMGRALDVTSAYVVEVSGDLITTVAEYYGAAANSKELVSDMYLTYPAAQFTQALSTLTLGRPVQVSTNDATTLPAEREHLEQYGARARLVVPLLHQGRALGYVELWESRRDRVFSEAEVNLAQTLAASAAAALENARLYAAARRHAEQMRLVNEVGRDITGILDVDALVAQVCHRLEGAFGYYHAKLGLIDGQEIVFGARLDERRGRGFPEQRFPLDGPGIIEWVAREAQPRYAAQTQPNPPLPPGTLPVNEVVAEVVVPLVAHDKTLGVLAVQVSQVGRVGPEEIAALEAISGQVAVALENARLFAEARSRAAEVTALLATTLAVTSTLELRPRLQAIIVHARELVGADSATIYQMSADGQLLTPTFVLDEMYAEETMADQIVVGDGLVGWVAETGVGAIFNRADLHPRVKVITGTPMVPECLLVVPLRLGLRTTGVLALYREGERDFTQHDFDLLTSFAAQAAVAVENAELYQKLRERAESLQAAYNELAEMDHLKDEMVQNISHELRTPLTFLKSYVDLLLGGDLGPLLPEQLRSLNVVRDKTELLVRLVNDIITLQAVTPATIARLPVDLLKLARGAAEGMAAMAQEADVRVTTELPANPLLVRGDALRLTQVLDNLLGNALKFTPAGGTIGLHMRPDGEWVRVEVRDTGIGIPRQNVERVFDRFYQVDGSARRKRGGIGLGLAICKRIVEVHGGQIGVESEEGVGSSFFFLLPRIEQP